MMLFIGASAHASPSNFDDKYNNRERIKAVLPPMLLMNLIQKYANYSINFVFQR